MQLAELQVKGLFGRYNHTVPMPTSPEDSDAASVVILHGPNGIGKTTVLQMLNGAMSLDFDPFRRVPFQEFTLRFNSGKELGVSSIEGDGIRVTFMDESALLHGKKKGPMTEAERESVEALRAIFLEYVSELSFEFLADTRLAHRSLWSEDNDDSLNLHIPWAESSVAGSTDRYLLDAYRHRANIVRQTQSSLAERVKRFTREAQVDYRPFFGTTEPDLFPKIIENLSNPIGSMEQPDALEKKLEQIRDLERTHSRLGLGRDRWDYDQLRTSVRSLRGATDNDHFYHALIVLNTYIESLESRAGARQLIAERLLTFEDVMLEFFKDKKLTISSRTGIDITSETGENLHESQLSSGEYQLLYLMVAALTTKRRGTVIAIDEPELSMHPAWTRRLVRNILRCASRATPQLILATHSIEIATDYADRLVKLSAQDAH